MEQGHILQVKCIVVDYLRMDFKLHAYNSVAIALIYSDMYILVWALHAHIHV